MRFLVRASYLQIYNEAISDLLKPERSNLSIREDKKRGVYVDGLSEWVVRSPAEIYGLMERGGAVRATGETKMNEVSSRSHAVFIVIAEQSETVYIDEHGAEMGPEEFQKFMHGRGVHREQEMSRLEDHVKQSFKVGKLNLVDLAGSERVRLSGATGQRLEESKQINRSLSALGNVISALTGGSLSLTFCLSLTHTHSFLLCVYLILPLSLSHAVTQTLSPYLYVFVFACVDRCEVCSCQAAP